MGSSSSAVATPGRRERQKQDRERRILKAARGLFDRKGYARAAMEDVAERAGLAVGTLYNYFASKDDLLLAIAQRETERLVAAGEHILAEPPRDPIAAIAAHADLFVQSITADERKLWRELFAAAIAAPQTLGARLFELDARLIAQLTALLEKLKQGGGIASDVDVGRAALTIYGVCVSWGLAFVMSEDFTADAMRGEITQAIRLIARGLLPHATGEEQRS